MFRLAQLFGACLSGIDADARARRTAQSLFGARCLAMMLFVFGLVHMSCTPEIGDQCSTSTDCSIRGDKLCDTSQPGGYCTVFNCTANSCVDEASCILFNPGVPGCAYNDRSPLPRAGRSFCIKSCESNDDCRGGYICADPRQEPWNARIIDEIQSKRVCLVATSSAVAKPDPATEPPVCGASSPDSGEWWDSGLNDAGDSDASDASLPDAPSDSADGGAGDAADGSSDANDAGG